MADLGTHLRRELRHAGDPVRAAGAQAYLKSAMPMYGVTMPELRRICRNVFTAHPIESAARWRGQILKLWRGAKHREERFAAIELSGFKRYREFQNLDALPMYEEMIVTGAWWDLVDGIAIHRIGAFLLRDHPREMKREMRRWSTDPDMWKRRTSILAQITFKKETDLKLLYDCIEPSRESREFFLRKAIGWALRQYAWSDPEEVTRYVRSHELSPLSRREALKNL